MSRCKSQTYSRIAAEISVHELALVFRRHFQSRFACNVLSRELQSRYYLFIFLQILIYYKIVL